MKTVCFIRQKPINLSISIAGIKHLWNTTFTTTHQEFRNQLRYLQVENLKDVGFDLICSEVEYAKKDCMILPVDDDDWFHPTVLSHLGEGKVYRWHHIQFCMNHVFCLERPFPQAFFDYQTNNYALRTPTDPKFLTSHYEADLHLRGRETYVPQCLSVYNKTLASVSMLHYCKGREHLLEWHRKSLEPLVIPPTVPDYFRPFFLRVQDMYRQLRSR